MDTYTSIHISVSMFFRDTSKDLEKETHGDRKVYKTECFKSVEPETSETITKGVEQVW